MGDISGVVQTMEESIMCWGVGLLSMAIAMMVTVYIEVIRRRKRQNISPHTISTLEDDQTVIEEFPGSDEERAKIENTMPARI